MEPETLGDLLDDNRYMMIDEQSRRNKAGYDSDFVDSVNHFYKDAAKVLGAKAVQKNWWFGKVELGGNGYVLSFFT